MDYCVSCVNSTTCTTCSPPKLLASNLSSCVDSCHDEEIISDN